MRGMRLRLDKKIEAIGKTYIRNGSLEVWLRCGALGPEETIHFIP